MNKAIAYILGIIIVVLLAAYLVTVVLEKNEPSTETGNQTETSTTLGYKDVTYTVEGQAVKLSGGVAETPSAPGSASKTTTKYFGNDSAGDLNGDTVPDVAFLLTQDTGGSGTFYYVTAAVMTASGYGGLNAIALGDRIAPQTTEIKDGEIVVNYAERKPGEPMTARPSVGVSKYFKVENNQLVEVSK